MVFIVFLGSSIMFFTRHYLLLLFLNVVISINTCTSYLTMAVYDTTVCWPLTNKDNCKRSDNAPLTWQLKPAASLSRAALTKLSRFHFTRAKLIGWHLVCAIDGSDLNCALTLGWNRARISWENLNSRTSC